MDGAKFQFFDEPSPKLYDEQFFGAFFGGGFFLGGGGRGGGTTGGKATYCM